MNAISFFLLNKIYNPRELDTTYLEDLYQYYESVSQELGYDINLKKEEFQDVIRVIFSVLSLRLSDEDFGTVIENYIKLLMADAKDRNIVDLKWAINHVWYLCAGESKEVSSEDYKDCIPFIQQSLIKKFGIEENIKERISRKIYTAYMANI